MYTTVIKTELPWLLLFVSVPRGTLALVSIITLTTAKHRSRILNYMTNCACILACTMILAITKSTLI